MKTGKERKAKRKVKKASNWLLCRMYDRRILRSLRKSGHPLLISRSLEVPEHGHDEGSTVTFRRFI